jgi:hypothetical protein
MMKKDTQIPQRKDEHIRINLEKDVASRLTTGLEGYRFVHQALPELSLAEVDLRQTLFGVEQRVPVLVSSMTGGTADAARINRHLAKRQRRSGWRWGSGPSGRRSRMRAWRRASRYGVMRPRSCCLPTWARYSSTMVTGSMNAGVRWR